MQFFNDELTVATRLRWTSYRLRNVCFKAVLEGCWEINRPITMEFYTCIGRKGSIACNSWILCRAMAIAFSLSAKFRSARRCIFYRTTGWRARTWRERTWIICKGCVTIPGLFLLSKVKTTVNGFPDDFGDQLMKLRTLNVQRNDETIESIEFDIVRIVE